ncbi:hypothetical protein KPSA1_00079 [Pseudomonas syringae pv. actinidiae]|uniref:Uncharacterized protein n=1 Tax=Pseudomonas syringae pv. actinidiae TaxID=103796 RepID=A0A2V0Q8P3_PSESF|nr:hypothetical protein KPSA1_00079 [Pseudomonas syringae pv. actinidiae]
MRAEAVQLFGHVAFLCQQNHLLLQPLRIELGFHVGKAVEHFLTLSGQHLGHQCAQGGNFLDNGRQALIQQPGQACTFTAAPQFQFAQRVIEQRQRLGVQHLRVAGIGDQHARPRQHLKRIQRGRLLDQAGNRFGGGDQLTRTLAINLQRLAGGLFDKAQGAFNLATRQALAQRFANRALQITERFRQAQVRLQVTMIDRAQLPAQCALGASPLYSGEGSHAVHNGMYLFVRVRRLFKSDGSVQMILFKSA